MRAACRPPDPWGSPPETPHNTLGRTSRRTTRGRSRRYRTGRSRSAPTYPRAPGRCASARVSGACLRLRIAPRVEALLQSAARRKFPFGFGGQAEMRAPLRRKPFAVCHRVEPIHRRGRLRKARKLGLLPHGHSPERFVVRVGGLVPAQQERREGYAVGGALIVAAVFLSHEERAAGNADQVAGIEASGAHLPRSKTVVFARLRPRGPGSPARCRRPQTRAACAFPRSCGRSPDKCTRRRVACRREPGPR